MCVPGSVVFYIFAYVTYTGYSFFKIITKSRELYYPKHMHQAHQT